LQVRQRARAQQIIRDEHAAGAADMRFQLCSAHLWKPNFQRDVGVACSATDACIESNLCERGSAFRAQIAETRTGFICGAHQCLFELVQLGAFGASNHPRTRETSALDRFATEFWQ
jgi:hypothetical protein